ncbi:MFS transporter [Nicoliella lavandulae]|uniref:MFS transporter n=1 Tax=Nicoliella lavandulae TaxID=3082954 RepID=A0ABU8SNR4_9LACO
MDQAVPSDNMPTITNRESKAQLIKAAASNLISALTGDMFSMAMGLMLLDRTHSPISFGIDMIITPIVSLLLMVPIGNLVDTYKHKHILIVSSALRILLIALFYFTLPLFPKNTILIPVVILLSGISVSVNINSTCYNSAVHELVNSNNIQKLNSLTQSAMALSMVVSPLISVGVYSLLGFDFFILIEIASNLISFCIMLSMKFHYFTEHKEQPSHEQSQLHKFKLAIDYIKKIKVIKYVILIGLVFNFFYAAISIGLPYVIKVQLHLGNGPLGIMNSLFAFGFLAGSVLSMAMSNVKYKYKFVLPVALFNLLFILLGFILMQKPTALTLNILGGALVAFMALIASLLNVAVQVFIQKNVENSMLGRINSLLVAINTSSMPVGIVVFTFIFDVASNGGVVYLVSGIIMMIYTFIFIPSLLSFFKQKGI